MVVELVILMQAIESFDNDLIVSDYCCLKIMYLFLAKKWKVKFIQNFCSKSVLVVMSVTKIYIAICVGRIYRRRE